MSAIHRRAADQVFDRLLERIVSGALSPGDRLDPTEIAESYGVSRTPVREAILKLDAEGLVERMPYRGVVVTGVDPSTAEDLAGLRIQLETLAVRAALPRLTDEDVDHMRDVHERLQVAVGGPQAQSAFAELNREFHLTLYGASGSPTMTRQINDLSAQAERIRLHFDIRHGHAVEDHARILAACAERDVEEAVAATRDHILGALSLMIENFEVSPGSVLGLALQDTARASSTT